MTWFQLSTAVCFGILLANVVDVILDVILGVMSDDGE